MIASAGMPFSMQALLFSENLNACPLCGHAARTQARLPGFEGFEHIMDACGDDCRALAEDSKK
jgi:hypothetical protein